MKSNEQIAPNPTLLPLASIPQIRLPEFISNPVELNSFVYQEYVHNSKKGKHVSFFSTESFYLIYCRSGSLMFYDNSKVKRVRPQESCIVYDAEGSGLFLEFGNPPSTRFLVIGFAKPPHGEKFRDTNCFNKVRRVFERYVLGNYFTGTLNLEIFEKINTLSRNSKNNVADEFIVEGILFQIYGLKMTQILEECKNGSKKYGGFSNWEMEQLKAISEYIVKNPGEEYTIDFLCHRTGLGPNKLQRAFKEMHNRTIIDYIRSVRLEKSLLLIKTTNMTISEIVYSVGLSSRSYFSKIFKMKYNCSPKNYQQKLKESAI